MVCVIVEEVDGGRRMKKVKESGLRVCSIEGDERKEEAFFPFSFLPSFYHERKHFEK